METETVLLSALRKPARNTRTHPPKQIAELVRAIEMFGQTRPVVIDEDNTVLAGNGLVAALKKLGRKETPAYRVTGLTPVQKHKLMLSDNRVYELGFDDHVGIMELIQSLDGDFEIPGFDAEILRSLHVGDGEATAAALSSYGVLSTAAVEAAKGRELPPPVPGAPPPSPQGEAHPGAEVTCPNCGGSFNADHH
jgi:hypothetical protein